MAQISKINGISIPTTTITGYTYDNVNTFTISQNDGVSFTASINNLNATSITGTTLYGDGGNLTNLNAFSTFSSTTVGQGSVIAANTEDTIRYSGVNIDILTDDTNKIITFSGSTGGGGGSGDNFYVTGGTVTSGGTLDLELKGTTDAVINLKETKELNILVFEGAAITSAPTYLTTTGALAHTFGGQSGGPTPDNHESALNFAVPSDYVSGGTFYIKFMTETTTTDNVLFEANITSIDVGGDFSTATDTGLRTVTQGSTAYHLIKSAAITGVTATFSAGKHVAVKLNRNSDDPSDDYNNNDVFLWGITFEYVGIK
jgi:hypothetical protein